MSLSPTDISPAVRGILERPAAVRTPWTEPASEGELSRWEGVALRVGEQLAADAVERDAAGRQPSAELRLLKDSGLVNLLIPRESGGEGAAWETGLRAVRVLSRYDARSPSCSPTTTPTSRPSPSTAARRSRIASSAPPRRAPGSGATP